MNLNRAAIPAVLLLTSSMSALGNPHLTLIESTPCLQAYRDWFYTDVRRRPAEFSAASAGATPEQCDEARRIHERIVQEQADQLKRDQDAAAAAARDEELRLQAAAADDAKRQSRARQAATAAAAAKQAAEDAQARKPGVRIGMTKAEVINTTSWGKPWSVRKTTNASGTLEQWHYGDSNFLYFEHGRLVTIQN